MKEYLINILIGFDQLINCFLRGDPDETLSSRAWRMDQKKQPYWGWTRRFIDGIFFLQHNHCKSAYNNEYLGRRI